MKTETGFVLREKIDRDGELRLTLGYDGACMPTALADKALIVTSLAGIYAGQVTFLWPKRTRGARTVCRAQGPCCCRVAFDQHPAGMGQIKRGAGSLHSRQHLHAARQERHIARERPPEL